MSISATDTAPLVSYSSPNTKRVVWTTADELRAIDGIYAAYMACNAADTEVLRSRLAQDHSKSSPMSKLADAGRASLRLVKGVSYNGGTQIWEAMCDGGSDAAWCIDLWVKGQF